MNQQPIFFDKEEVIRRLLIITEAVSKLPDNLLISFNVNLNVLDKQVRETLDSIDKRVNSAYQAPFKLQILDDTKGVADDLLKTMGFPTNTKEPGVPKKDLLKKDPPPSGDTFRFSSDDSPSEPPDA